MVQNVSIAVKSAIFALGITKVTTSFDRRHRQVTFKCYLRNLCNCLTIKTYTYKVKHD